MEPHHVSVSDSSHKILESSQVSLLHISRELIEGGGGRSVIVEEEHFLQVNLNEGQDLGVELVVDKGVVLVVISHDV